MPKRTRKTTDHAPMEFSLMAIGAHADDIELQAGGTLAKYHAAGYDIIYVMSTNNMSGGEAAIPEDGDPTPLHLRVSALRKSEAEASARALGTQAIHLDHSQRHYMTRDRTRIKAGYGNAVPEGCDPGLPCIITAYDDQASIDRVADMIVEHDPEAVLTHGGPMRNIEHFGTQILVTEAYWNAVKRGYEGMLLHWHDLGVNTFAEAYKKWSSFVDISDYWDAKIQLCAIHKTMKPDPAALDWPQWGPACGCRHAEVFTIVGRNKQPVQYGAFTLEILRNER